MRFYRLPTKLQEGNVFTGVCLSTGRGVGISGPCAFQWVEVSWKVGIQGVGIPGEVGKPVIFGKYLVSNYGVLFNHIASNKLVLLPSLS